MNGERQRPGFFSVVLTILIIVGIIVALIVGVTACATGFERPEAGKIGVVRNGGPFDDRNIREVLPPGASRSWVGILSNTHFYPTSTVQRFYTITGEGTGDTGAVDVVRTQTSDGFLVGLEGTFYFTTGFDGSDEGQELVQKFDEQFGVRTFGQNDLHPYEGDSGWSAFLNTIVRPVIDTELRQTMLQYKCEELISSCAIVASQGDVTVGEDTGNETNANLQRIAQDVQEAVAKEVSNTLGQPYLANWQFELVRPTLPESIQVSINQAQSAFAKITEAEAERERASVQREAAEELAEIYEQSPALAQIAMIREAKDRDGHLGSNVYIGINPVIPTTPRP